MRPYVICHMMMSVDGRIISSRWQLSPAGRAEYEATGGTHSGDAWMCGRITMAAFAQGDEPPTAGAAASASRVDFIAPHQESTFAVALDASGRLRWQRREIGGDHLITLLTEQVSDAYLEHLRTAGLSYLFGGRSTIAFPS